MNRGVEEVVVVHRHGEFQTLGEVFLHDFNLCQAFVDDFGSVGACRLEHDGHGSRFAVKRRGVVVGYLAEFHIGHILEIEHIAVGIGAHNDVFEFLGGFVASAILHRVLERLLALGAERTGGGLDVLVAQGGCDIGRGQSVLCHDFGLDPYTHGVVAAEAHHVAHALYTLKNRDDVDFHVVVEELAVVVGGVGVKGHTNEHGALAFARNHTYLGYFGWEEVLGLRNTVLHVDGSHVGVEALFEVNVDRCRTGVGCGRFHVGHTLGTVDRFLKRCDH